MRTTTGTYSQFLIQPCIVAGRTKFLGGLGTSPSAGCDSPKATSFAWAANYFWLIRCVRATNRCAIAIGTRGHLFRDNVSHSSAHVLHSSLGLVTLMLRPSVSSMCSSGTCHRPWTLFACFVRAGVTPRYNEMPVSILTLRCIYICCDVQSLRTDASIRVFYFGCRSNTTCSEFTSCAYV